MRLGKLHCFADFHFAQDKQCFSFTEFTPAGSRTKGKTIQILHQE